ncbi:GDSL-type esterase/lipase family protein [Leptospira sp. 96542]|nr:GDSL-type esterase/lipase family protein [Leptospira sp. 96542]
MNHKSKNRLPYFLFFLLFAVATTACRSFVERKNYFHPRFECFAEPGYRNSKDFNHYIEKIWQPLRLVYQAENQKIGKSKIVFVGNSLVILFFPNLLQKEFPGESIANRGIGGDMSETLLARLDEDVLSLAPEKLVIEIGGNDFIQGKCLSLVQNNLKAIVQKVHSKNPNIEIYLLSVPPTRVRELNQIVPVYNLFLSQVARETKNVEYIETWDLFRKENEPSLKDEFLRENGDPLHFNDKGYEVWGKRLRPYLQNPK